MRIWYRLATALLFPPIPKDRGKGRLMPRTYGEQSMVHYLAYCQALARYGMPTRKQVKKEMQMAKLMTRRSIELLDRADSTKSNV